MPPPPPPPPLSPQLSRSGAAARVATDDVVSLRSPAAAHQPHCCARVGVEGALLA
jgi:hypothetical protein